MFNDSSIRINNSFSRTFCKDFSFHINDKSSDSDLNHYNEEKLKSIYDDVDLLSDDLIEKTSLIEKSPTALENKRFSSSPNLINKSPTLDNYLIPNKTNKTEQSKNILRADCDRYENKIKSANAVFFGPFLGFIS